MTRNFVCIECPRGCELTAEKTESGVSVTWNFCPRGKKYAEAEMTCPRRIVTSTVRAAHGMIPVKTDGEVKKEKIFGVMARIRALRIDRDVLQGETLIADIDGEGTPLIAAAAYRNEDLEKQQGQVACADENGEE